MTLAQPDTLILQGEPGEVDALDSSTRASHTPTGPGAGEPPSVSSRKPGLRRFLLLGLTITVAVAGVTLAVFPNRGTQAHADDLLLKAAQKAGDPPVRSNQFWQIDTRSQQRSPVVNPLGFSTGGYLVERQRTTWVSVDGSRPTCVQEDDWRSLGSYGLPLNAFEPISGFKACDETTPNDRPGTWREPNDEWLAGLPRDPALLFKRLDDDATSGGESREHVMFSLAVDALSSWRLPADVRASVFVALTMIPGVQVLDDDVHAAGQPAGIALGIASRHSDGVDYLILDRQTHDLLGRGYRLGAFRNNYTAFMTRTVVDEIPPAFLDQACTWLDAGGMSCSRR